MNNGDSPLTYEQCHAKHDTTLEPLDMMTLIGLQATVKDSNEQSDIQFFRAIQWEIKTRAKKRTADAMLEEKP